MESIKVLCVLELELGTMHHFVMDLCNRSSSTTTKWRRIFCRDEVYFGQYESSLKLLVFSQKGRLIVM